MQVRRDAEAEVVISKTYIIKKQRAVFTALYFLVYTDLAEFSSIK